MSPHRFVTAARPLPARRLVVASLLGALAYVWAGAALHAATCTGAAPCKACKNCSSCAHCAKRGGTCGVCRRAAARPGADRR